MCHLMKHMAFFLSAGNYVHCVHTYITNSHINTFTVVILTKLSRLSPTLYLLYIQPKDKHQVARICLSKSGLARAC